MKPWTLIVLGFIFLLLTGCSEGPKSSYGFTLPDGDAASGRDVFVSHMCHQCHTVSGVELPTLDGVGERRIQLGGEVTRIQTYGELVTSVINPSHKLATGYSREAISHEGQSKMINYNDAMTVTDLIDVVAFLQSKYELKPYEPSSYDLYEYGP